MKSTSGRPFFWLGTVVLVLSLNTVLLAQSDRGSITGLVTDSTGAVVARASVIVTNAATNTSRETVTSEAGKYVFRELPAAIYGLSIKQPGFRTYRQDGITVGVSQAITQDVMLQVGEVTETVEVHADASMLKTESAEISTSVTPEKISELPIDFSGAMRNPMSFLRLVPGASVSRDQSWPVTSQNGLQSFAEEIRIDGALQHQPDPRGFQRSAALGGRHSGDQCADRQLQCRVRAGRRRDYELHTQVGHQSTAWHRL